MTLQVGLIGYPVEHSLSPAFQQAAFDALGIDARYLLWSTPPEQVVARIEWLRSPGVLGANVTVPHKQAAFACVDEVSDRARRSGAVNTIVNRDGQLYGDNTDIPGFLATLRDRSLLRPSASVTVLGAGGAARGILVALLSGDCTRITLANRTPEVAANLVRAIEPSISVGVAPLDESLESRLVTTTLLVNATSIGWEGEALPIAEPLLDALPPAALVYDLTYRETPLLRAATRRGLATLDGLELLVCQGAESFRLWTGQEPPRSLMRSAAVTARDSRA
jgi:shikimate dehydrogenase